MGIDCRNDGRYLYNWVLIVGMTVDTSHTWVVTVGMMVGTYVPGY